VCSGCGLSPGSQPGWYGPRHRAGPAACLLSCGLPAAFWSSELQSSHLQRNPGTLQAERENGAREGWTRERLETRITLRRGVWGGRRSEGL